MFTKVGTISYAGDADEDAIMEQALELGADDVVTNEDGSIDVVTTPETFTDIKEALIAAGLEPAHAEVEMKASVSVDLDLEAAEKIMRLIDMLEDLDDVQNVYSNAEFSEEVMAAL